MEVVTEAAEVGGRTATKENADPVANQGITSPKIEPHEEKELPVTVALMVRPLVGGELVDGCRECVTVHANEPSISLVCKEHKFISSMDKVSPDLTWWITEHTETVSS